MPRYVLLEPLYEACLQRMESFVTDFDREGHAAAQAPTSARCWPVSKRTPTAATSSCKAIIVNNLYGVDIMEEAVEICKLRLFLTLVSQVRRCRRDLEPLPDIDFNIRAGNTLVGFATLDAVPEAAVVQRAMLWFQRDAQYRRGCRDVSAPSAVPRSSRPGTGRSPRPETDKQNCASAGRLGGALDRFLAAEYGIALPHDHRCKPSRGAPATSPSTGSSSSTPSSTSAAASMLSSATRRMWSTRM